jgi:hypothetical protein
MAVPVVFGERVLGLEERGEAADFFGLRLVGEVEEGIAP